MWFLWILMSLGFATDMAGVWQTNDATTFIIPFMRDGDIPLIVKKNKSDAVLWGRWSMEKESLTIKQGIFMDPIPLLLRISCR